MPGREVRAGKAYVEIALKDKVQGGLRRVATRLRAFGSTVGAIGAGLAGTGMAIAGPLAWATKTFAGFQDQMLAVRSVTGAAGAAFDKLNEQAKRLGRTTSFTAAEVAGGMLSLGRAGFAAKEIEAAIPGVLNLARATGTDLAQSADIAAGTLRAFSMEADQMGRVTDVLVATANNSAQTLEDLGQSMTYAAPIAEEYGMSLEQTAKALGVLANMQIKGSMAGTSLRQMMLRLADRGVQDRLRSVGVEALDAAGNLRPIGDVLLELGKAMQGMTSGQRLALGKELFDQRAAAGALKLAKSDFPALQQAIDNAGGTAARTAKVMDSGVGGAFRRLMSAAEGVQIAIGEGLSSALGGVMDKLGQWLGAVTQWIGQNKELVVGVGLAAAALLGTGAALLGIAGAASVASFVVSGLATAFGAVMTVLGVLVSPIGLVVAGIAAAIGAWLAFSNSGREAASGFMVILKDLWANVKRVFGGISDALAAGDFRLAARILWNGLKVIFWQGAEQIARTWSTVAEKANQVWASIRQAAGRAVDWLKSVWARLPSFITGPLEAVGTALGGLGKYLLAVFGDLFGKLGGIFDSMFGGLVDAISAGDWEAAGQVIMSGLEAAWLTGVAKLTEIWNGLKVAMIEAFAGVVIAVHRMWSGMVESLANSLLDLAAQDGAVGAVARKLVGVDMRAEDARAQKLERERRDVAKRNLQWTIGQWEQELSVATDAGDTQEVERLSDAIAQAKDELASLSGPIDSATQQAKQIVQDATRDAQDAVGAYWGDVAGDARQKADAKVAEARRAAEDARRRLDQTVGQPSAGDQPTTGGKSALQQAQEELDAALAEAKKKPGMFDAEAGQGKVDEAGDAIGGVPGAPDASDSRGGEIQGTFSAMAIRGLGADSLAERTAKSNEQIARNTKQLVKEARSGGLVFG